MDTFCKTINAINNVALIQIVVLMKFVIKTVALNVSIIVKFAKIQVHVHNVLKDILMIVKTNNAINLVLKMLIV